MSRNIIILMIYTINILLIITNIDCIIMDNNGQSIILGDNVVGRMFIDHNQLIESTTLMNPSSSSSSSTALMIKLLKKRSIYDNNNNNNKSNKNSLKTLISSLKKTSFNHLTKMSKPQSLQQKQTQTLSSKLSSSLWNIFHWFRPSDRMSITFLPIFNDNNIDGGFIHKTIKNNVNNNNNIGRRRRFHFNGNPFIPVRGKKSFKTKSNNEDYEQNINNNDNDYN